KPACSAHTPRSNPASIPGAGQSISPMRFARVMRDDLSVGATATGLRARSGCACGEHGQILGPAAFDRALVAVARAQTREVRTQRRERLQSTAALAELERPAEVDVGGREP